jgi:hypothetical protein
MLHRFEAIGHQVTNLKTLKVEHYVGSEAMQEKTFEDFIVGVQGLVTFEYVSQECRSPAVLVSAAAQQGDTLETLSIQIPKESWSEILTPFNKARLDTIKTSCANLSSLKLDMQIHDYMVSYCVVTRISLSS